MNDRWPVRSRQIQTTHFRLFRFFLSFESFFGRSVYVSV